MHTFLALLVAPSLALAAQSFMFSLVTPSCAFETRVGIHLVALATLALIVAFAFLAHRDWRLAAAVAGGEDERRQGRVETRRFLAASGTAVASLSALVIVMMWFAAWVLSPCSPF